MKLIGIIYLQTPSIFEDEPMPIIKNDIIILLL